MKQFLASFLINNIVDKSRADFPGFPSLHEGTPLSQYGSQLPPCCLLWPAKSLCPLISCKLCLIHVVFFSFYHYVMYIVLPLQAWAPAIRARGTTRVASSLRWRPSSCRAGNLGWHLKTPSSGMNMQRSTLTSWRRSVHLDCVSVTCMHSFSSFLPLIYYVKIIELT